MSRTITNISRGVALVLLSFALLTHAEEDEIAPVQINRDELVMISVKGAISQPGMRKNIYRVSADGLPQVFPGTGGITYNFRVGDSAVHLAGNHVEPAVSIENLGPDDQADGRESRGLNALANIGNEAMVITGDAKGARGAVIGKHGGIEHVMVDFKDDAVYDNLAIGDEIQIRGYGTGMRLTNVEGVTVMNIGPRLFDALSAGGMARTADGKLRIGVTHLIPAKIMGSGLGRDQTYTGDYDINFFDPETVEEYDLDTLRFGDIVAIVDADSTYGRVYRQGAITIASVSHGRSDSAGHGPGVTTLFTSKTGQIEAFKTADANLAKLLKLRRLK
ncbi:MAG: DUF4438 domain-containing protein [Woeseia sp.]